MGGHVAPHLLYHTVGHLMNGQAQCRSTLAVEVNLNLGAASLHRRPHVGKAVGSHVLATVYLGG